MPEHDTTDTLELRERIDRFLAGSALAAPHSRIVPLTGDASDRKYFRVLPPDRGPVVLALHAGPIDVATLPFVNVAELMHQVPLPVPKILGHSNELGVLALQDLGDVTLQAYLGGATADAQLAQYRRSVELIELMQRRGAELASNRYVPYSIAFDVDKLTWELEFFTKHFMEGYRGVRFSTADRAVLTEAWSAIARELAGETRVLCHRDYHSRNLMVRDDELFVIDFQDARMGPDTYDLVSLLRDSYVDISDEDSEALMALFLTLKTRHAPVEVGDFKRRFDLMALQRNLKALGTFGYQTTTRQNPVYIKYVPRTLRYVRTNLARQPRFARLRAVLSAHIDELR
ncbi:MAG TPA: phosphotransferase [Vicinamibacterales bacterium]|jgi:hypothetical protein